MKKEFFESIGKETYTKRNADSRWMKLINERVQIKGKVAVDIGAGGGIYSMALADLGAHKVIAVDISENMLEGARGNCAEYVNIDFQVGNSHNSGLPAEYADVVLERALIHHLKEEQLDGCFAEAKRILKDNGTLIIQDRTVEDCLLEGSSEHIRGYFFDIYPRLCEKDISRRFSVETVDSKLKAAGFKEVEAVSFWENRKVYETPEEQREEIVSRKGRSILFELNDEEISHLADEVLKKIPAYPVHEKERWTIWFAQN